MAKELFFVYGTLKEGFHNHRLLKEQEAKKIGNGSVLGVMTDMGGYPALFPIGDKLVHGEVYEVDEPRSARKELDRLERYNEKDEARSMYLRRKIKVTMDEATVLEAWAYVMRSVESGVWSQKQE